MRLPRGDKTRRKPSPLYLSHQTAPCTLQNKDSALTPSRKRLTCSFMSGSFLLFIMLIVLIRNALLFGSRDCEVGRLASGADDGICPPFRSPWLDELKKPMSHLCKGGTRYCKEHTSYITPFGNRQRLIFLCRPNPEKNNTQLRSGPSISIP